MGLLVLKLSGSLLGRGDCGWEGIEILFQQRLEDFGQEGLGVVFRGDMGDESEV